MKTYPLWSLTAVAIAVAACTCPEVRTASVAASPRPGAPHSDRNCKTGDNCVVFVDVTDCTKAGGITVDASALGILADTRNIDIYWVIRTSNYAFTKDGIKFKDESYKKEFDQPRPGHTVYAWRDRNDQGGTPFRPYYYTVTLVNTTGSGQQCLPLDPTIINDY